MLNWHIVTFLDHWILQVTIGTGANVLLRWPQVVERSETLGLKAALGRIEHNRVLQVLVARLVESLWPLMRILGFLVLSRPRDIKFQTLTVVSLIEVEAGWSAIKPNFLAHRLLKITRTSLLDPLRFAVCWVAEAGDLILYSNLVLIVHHNFAVESLCHELLAWDSLAGEQAHIRVFGIVGEIKTVCSWWKYWIWHLLFDICWSAHTSLWGLPNQGEVSGGVCKIFMDIVLTRRRALLSFGPESSSLRCRSKSAKLHTLRSS